MSGWTQKDLDRLKRKPLPARAKPQAVSGMNKTEAAYAQHLDLLKHAGEIHEWWFEPLKLRIGKACTYTPDFLVQLPDGTLELHEVKGFFRDDARVKCRAVAERYPFRLLVIRRQKGEWTVEDLSS